ncbi:MAG: multicopper oxidase domain-containing protein [Flavobacteriales bacterium]
MKKALTLLVCLSLSVTFCAQYNQLWIPDTLAGTTFNLNLVDTFAQLRPGNQTITAGINNKFWGPTLFVNKGDTIHMNVQNDLNEATTLHWHGFHLPAVMDGGPHQVIPPGTLWQPYWKITNNAATYWFHPHLHEMTQEHVTKGLGGLIIVRDEVEAALSLPRAYGLDDIPIVLTSRRYDNSNQFVFENTAYGDYLLTNGIPDAEFTLPQQVVRMRILNADIERGYNLGFSDNRSFHIITNDGGLLNEPVEVTRVKLLVGERVEILVNLSADEIGSEPDLMTYNSGQTFGFPGGEPNTSGEFGSLLNNLNFTVLHINVGEPTEQPITAIPASLASSDYLAESDATNSRTVNITDGQPGGDPFSLDNNPFDFDVINHTIDAGTIEEWTIVNNNVFGHSFHIHDVQFKIISRSSGPVGEHESGWKDTFFIAIGESVSFVAKFSDEADPEHPFMYHCHFANHEDGGMMGQFVVDGESAIDESGDIKSDYTVYPNPVNDKLFVVQSNNQATVYYITIVNSLGKVVVMLPQPDLSQGIDITKLSNGIYYMQITDKATKSISTQKFVVE